MTVRCSRLLRGRKRPGLDVSIFICSPDLGLEWIGCNPCPGETIRDHFKGQLLAYCDVADTVRSTIIEHRRSDEMMDRMTDVDDVIDRQGGAIRRDSPGVSACSRESSAHRGETVLIRLHESRGGPQRTARHLGGNLRRPWSAEDSALAPEVSSLVPTVPELVPGSTTTNLSPNNTCRSGMMAGIVASTSVTTARGTCRPGSRSVGLVLCA